MAELRNSGNPPRTELDTHEDRASAWRPFVLLRTVIEQSSSSLVTEALITLDKLEADIERLREAEALGDA